jgi:hypothetical protein
MCVAERPEKSILSAQSEVVCSASAGYKEDLQKVAETDMGWKENELEITKIKETLKRHWIVVTAFGAALLEQLGSVMIQVCFPGPEAYTVTIN